MTLKDAVLAFDSIRPLDPGWHNLESEGSDIGIPVCCNLPVVKDSHDGQEKFYCLECHRTIAVIGRQWVVSNWGSKGFKFIFLEGDNALLKSFQDIQRKYPLP